MPLDEIDEQVLVLTKEYNIPYLTLMDDTTYTDIGVLYAKVANSKAFEAYSQYISLDEKGRADHVKDYGEPKPYEYEVITAEMQERYAEQQQNELQKMYKRQGSI